MGECTTPPLSEVRNALSEVLAALQVSKVVVIDDEYSQQALQTEDIVGFVQANPENFLDLIPGLDKIEPNEPEIIASAVARMLEGEGAKGLQERVLALGMRVEGMETESGLDAAPDAVLVTEHRTREVLEILCSELQQPFVAISATEWEVRKQDLLSTDEGRALVLVDRNFKEEGKNANYGLELIRELVAMSEETRPYCALFSHTVLPAAELHQWYEIADAHHLARDRFVVISKARLGENEPDYVGFIHLLRMAALSGPLEQLRNGAAALLASAVIETRTEMETWTVFDLDQVVLRSSHHEGVWEGDTLLRVMARFTLSKARNRFLADESARSHLAIARRASAVVIPGKERYPWSDIGRVALDYQRTELYESGDFVNPHCLAIDAGDVFTDSNGKDFVLLAQPCDLMVRNDSGRAYDKNHVLMVPLCEVRSNAEASPKGYTLNHWATNGTPGHVRFIDVHLVRLVMLDLCAFQEDGQSRFIPGQEPNESLSPAWRAHYTRVQEALKREWDLVCENIKALNEATLEKTVRDRLVRSAMPLCSNTGRFRATQMEKGFCVNLKRTARICPSLAADILRAFARYQSRVAFEHPVVTEELTSRLVGAAKGGD